MRESVVCAFVLGVFLGFIVGGAIFTWATSQDWHRSETKLKQKAIDQGAAQYNPTTAEFEWIEKPKLLK